MKHSYYTRIQWSNINSNVVEPTHRVIISKSFYMNINSNVVALPFQPQLVELYISNSIILYEYCITVVATLLYSYYF